MDTYEIFVLVTVGKKENDLMLIKQTDHCLSQNALRVVFKSRGSRLEGVEA